MSTHGIWRKKKSDIYWDSWLLIPEYSIKGVYRWVHWDASGFFLVCLGLFWIVLGFRFSLDTNLGAQIIQIIKAWLLSGRLWASLGASFHVLGASWGVLGASWGCLGTDFHRQRELNSGIPCHKIWTAASSLPAHFLFIEQFVSFVLYSTLVARLKMLSVDKYFYSLYRLYQILMKNPI